MRDNLYLENRMYHIWDEYFADVPRKNLVLIKFGKYSKKLLGSIRWVNERSKVRGLLKKKQAELEYQDDPRVTLIMITRYFKEIVIPEYVVDMTIAHEMVHYAHGFHSPLPKQVQKPHQGGVVDKELVKRGLGDGLEAAEIWIKENWVNFLTAQRR